MGSAVPYREKVHHIRRSLLTKMPYAPQVARHAMALLATLVVLAGIEFSVASIGFWTWAAAATPVVGYAAERSYQSWRNRRNDRSHVSTIVSLEGKDLSNLDLTEIKLFEREDLATLTCQHSVLRHAVLIRADLPRSSFKQSDLSYANLSGANCEEAKFYRTRMFDATLDRVQASAARFEDADLRHASFNGAKLLNARFDNADLRDASFVDARLINARFDGADVRGTDFTGSTLEPDALVDAICDTETVVPDDCQTGKRRRTDTGLGAYLQATVQSAVAFSVRPVMYASGWALAVVFSAVLAGQVEPISYEIAADRVAPSSDRSREILDTDIDRALPGESDSAAELVGSTTEPTASADAAFDGAGGGESGPGNGTAGGSTGDDSEASTDSAQSLDSETAPASGAQTETTSTVAPTTTSTTTIQPTAPEPAQPAPSEVPSVAPPLLETGTVPQAAANGSTTATTPETTAVAELLTVKLVAGSEGGSSTAGYTSNVGNGGPFLADDQTVQLSIETGTGIVTVSVSPNGDGTVAFCSIEVGTEFSNESRGLPGQAVTCTLDLGG